LFPFFLGLVLGIPLGIVTFTMDSNSAVALVVTTVINVLSSVITTPFMAAVLILIYFDLRVRKEGFDLQLLSQGVGMEGAVLPAQAPWLAGGGGGQWGTGGVPWGGGGGQSGTGGVQWGGGGGQWGAGGQWGNAGGNWPPPGGNWPPPGGNWP